jgi:hypothetical protein
MGQTVRSGRMSDHVWISEIFSDYTLGNKLGLRWKFPGEDWSSPKHFLDTPTDRELARVRDYRDGRGLSADAIPEAIAIWEAKSFRRARDVFSIGSMFILKPKLAELFARFDLGQGGVEPITVYEEDLQTRAKGDYFMLHFGGQKDSFLPERSNKEGYRIHPLAVDRNTGRQIWSIECLVQDGDVVVSPAALEGPELWGEVSVHSRLFMSARLGEALREPGATNVDWQLKKCRVVDPNVEPSSDLLGSLKRRLFGR